MLAQLGNPIQVALGQITNEKTYLGFEFVVVRLQGRSFQF